MSSPKCKVIRDHEQLEVDSSELVPGDIVVIEAGDIVPADGRIIENFSLLVNENSLTGESNSIEKTDEVLTYEDLALGDQVNMVFSGSLVNYGRAKILITETGMSTQLGKIATLLDQTEENITPLQKSLDIFGKRLTLGIVVLCVFIFGIYVYHGNTILDSLLLAVALAVAAIPESLNPIITIVLSLETEKLAKENAAAKKPISIGVVGNAADMYEKVLASDFRPDICSEMCPCHDPISYLPSGYTAEEADELRINDRDKYLHLARETMKRQLAAMVALKADGVEVFEYGTSIRKECMDAGFPRKEAMKIKGFVAEYIRPLFCEGRGPFRWTCLSRDPEDLKVSDNIALEICKGDKLVERWINLARKNLPIEGMPARVCYMGFGERKKFGLAINQAIKEGRIKGTVAFSRDNLDSGSIVNPTFESENMPDGGDYISDWPYLNALLDCAAGCDLIAIQQNYSMGEAVHTGVTMIADGTEEADRRLAACLTTDSGIGVIRHAQAGYKTAKDVANGKGKFTTDSIKVPLWWQPAEKVTFGPKGKYR